MKMHSFIGILIFSFLTSTYSDNLIIKKEHPKAFENKIREAFECVQNNLNKGIPEVGIPSFNPLQIDSLTINLTTAIPSKIVNGEIILNDLILKNSTNWNFESLSGSFSVIPPKYTITFKLINRKILFGTLYKMNTSILEMNLIGSGDINATIANAYVNGTIVLSVLTRKPYIRISKAYVEIGLESIDFKITGFDNNEIISNQISEDVSLFLPIFLKQNKEYISRIISGLLVNSGSTGTNPKIDAIIDALARRCSPFLV